MQYRYCGAHLSYTMRTRLFTMGARRAGGAEGAADEEADEADEVLG
jgi:hypothetical protein